MQTLIGLDLHEILDLTCDLHDMTRAGRILQKQKSSPEFPKNFYLKVANMFPLTPISIAHVLTLWMSWLFSTYTEVLKTKETTYIFSHDCSFQKYCFIWLHSSSQGLELMHPVCLIRNQNYVSWPISYEKHHIWKRRTQNWLLKKNKLQTGNPPSEIMQQQ